MSRYIHLQQNYPGHLAPRKFGKWNGEKKKILSRRFKSLWIASRGLGENTILMLCLSFFSVVSWCCRLGHLLRQHKGLPGKCSKCLYSALKTWNGDLMQSHWRLQACLEETDGKICPPYTACFSANRIAEVQNVSPQITFFRGRSRANEPGKGKLSVSSTESLLCMRNPLFQPARLNSHY